MYVYSIVVWVFAAVYSLFTDESASLRDIRDFLRAPTGGSPVTGSLGAAAIVAVVPLSGFGLLGSWLSIQSEWYWNGLAGMMVVLYGPMLWIALKWILVKCRLARDALTARDDVMAAVFTVIVFLVVWVID